MIQRKSKVSKSEALSVLAMNQTNLFKATKHAASIAKLQEALYEDITNDDSLLETGKTLLIVDYLLNTLSNHGNQEISASVAFALSMIVNNAANEIRSFLEDIGKEKEGSAS